MLRSCLKRHHGFITKPARPQSPRQTRHASDSKPNAPLRSRIYTSLPTPLRWLLDRSHSIARGTTIGIALFLAWHIEYSYFFEYNGCHGISMLPTFNSFGDAVLISKYHRRGRGVNVGDLVSFAHPVDAEQRAIKRVLGMPGDFVCRDTPGTSGKMLQVPKGHCWVVGDNLGHSRDSRMFGPLPLALVKGKVIARFSPWYWPHRLRNGLQPAVPENDVE